MKNTPNMSHNPKRKKEKKCKKDRIIVGADQLGFLWLTTNNQSSSMNTCLGRAGVAAGI